MSFSVFISASCTELTACAAHESERNLFHACMLRFFGSAGFKLDGSIPIGRKDPVFWGPRKDLWIFRSVPMRRPESRQKQ